MTSGSSKSSEIYDAAVQLINISKSVYCSNVGQQHAALYAYRNSVCCDLLLLLLAIPLPLA